jgi:uncharacterized membrane protein YsdA (DUF1294 family)
MNAALLALASATSFACIAPTHHDGDNVRCANIEQSIRLEGIDAPEMPGSCRAGRRCTPGDPYAARDYLRALTLGRTLNCEAETLDRYGRVIARCAVDGVDLSCAMISAGQAVPRYADIDCSGAVAAPAIPEQAAPEAAPPAPPQPMATPDWPVIDRVVVPVDAPLANRRLPDWPWLACGWLLLINLFTYAAFAIDKAQARRHGWRLPERWSHTLAALGGSPAAWMAINRLRHKSAKDSFKLTLLLISGLQIGALAGGLWWWLYG